MSKKSNKIPEPTISRLPVYLSCLYELKNNDVAIVSSEEISTRTGIKASQFRKDMSYFGEFGIQGLGYPITQLLERISNILQVNKLHKAVLVGVGHLGQALARYNGFSKWGFKIEHLYDSDPGKIGTEVNGIVIEDINDMPDSLKASIGIISVPAEHAQKTAHKLIKSGITALLNFSGVQLNTGKEVIVRTVDLSHELAILNYFHLTRQKPKKK